MRVTETTSLGLGQTMNDFKDELKKREKMIKYPEQ